MSMEEEKLKNKVLLTQAIKCANGRTRLRIAFYQAVQPHGYNWQQVKAVLDQVEACNFDPFLQMLQDATKGSPP